MKSRLALLCGSPAAVILAALLIPLVFSGSAEAIVATSNPADTFSDGGSASYDSTSDLFTATFYPELFTPQGASLPDQVTDPSRIFSLQAMIDNNGNLITTGPSANNFSISGAIGGLSIPFGTLLSGEITGFSLVQNNSPLGGGVEFDFYGDPMGALAPYFPGEIIRLEFPNDGPVSFSSGAGGFTVGSDYSGVSDTVATPEPSGATIACVLLLCSALAGIRHRFLRLRSGS